MQFVMNTHVIICVNCACKSFIFPTDLCIHLVRNKNTWLFILSQFFYSLSFSLPLLHREESLALADGLTLATVTQAIATLAEVISGSQLCITMMEISSTQSQLQLVWCVSVLGCIVYICSHILLAWKCWCVSCAYLCVFLQHNMICSFINLTCAGIACIFHILSYFLGVKLCLLLFFKVLRYCLFVYVSKGIHTLHIKPWSHALLHICLSVSYNMPKSFL